MNSLKKPTTVVIPLFLLIQAVDSACDMIDHQTCDELCKVDNFWYGHCAGWDGTDFSCKCYEYQAPLDGQRCRNKQKRCKQRCMKQGAEGGFCYPQLDSEFRTRRTACQCFKELPVLRRRRDVNQNRYHLTARHHRFKRL